MTDPTDQQQQTEPKWTRETWHVSKGGPRIYAGPETDSVTEQCRRNRVSMPGHSNNGEREAETNELLEGIAALPRLYRALEAADKWITENTRAEDRPAWLDKMRMDALSEARGTTEQGE